jgi:hypothetical protein
MGQTTLNRGGQDRLRVQGESSRRAGVAMEQAARAGREKSADMDRLHRRPDTHIRPDVWVLALPYLQAHTAWAQESVVHSTTATGAISHICVGGVQRRY